MNQAYEMLRNEIYRRQLSKTSPDSISQAYLMEASQPTNLKSDIERMDGQGGYIAPSVNPPSVGDLIINAWLDNYLISLRSLYSFTINRDTDVV